MITIRMSDDAAAIECGDRSAENQSERKISESDPAGEVRAGAPPYIRRRMTGYFRSAVSTAAR